MMNHMVTKPIYNLTYVYKPFNNSKQPIYAQENLGALGIMIHWHLTTLSPPPMGVESGLRKEREHESKDKE